MYHLNVQFLNTLKNDLIHFRDACHKITKYVCKKYMKCF